MSSSAFRVTKVSSFSPSISICSDTVNLRFKHKVRQIFQIRESKFYQHVEVIRDFFKMDVDRKALAKSITFFCAQTKLFVQ